MNFLLTLIICKIFRMCSAIRVEEVVVPPTAITGNSIELQCLYIEEGDDLYTLKWWRGEDQFYQYVPPKRSFFSTPGIHVDMNATTYANRHHTPGLERVILKEVDLDSAGRYKCEVMAEKIFTTVSREANMTVIVPPPGPPTIYGASPPEEKVRLGQKISLKCSIPPSTPPPRIMWSINGKVPFSGWVTNHPPSSVGRLYQVVSLLEFIVSHKILDESYDGLVIECAGRQNGSHYNMVDRIIRHPEKTSYFWFFTRANASNQHPTVLWLVLLLIVMNHH